MIIRYYKDERLAYANRRRYLDISSFNYIEEEQRSVLLGDGATTQLKTKKENICNYVTIDNTRWYVTSHYYFNGSQVMLNLQRDVIGEFGINNCFGKIERGYTDSVLRNRKELSLNQILKRRIPLKPQTNKYGNYSVDNHNGECWGVLYLVKPKNETEVNINIPNITYDSIVTPLNNVPAKKSSYNSSNCKITFVIGFINNSNQIIGSAKVDIEYDRGAPSLGTYNVYELNPNKSFIDIYYKVNTDTLGTSSVFNTIGYAKVISKQILGAITQQMSSENPVYKYPENLPLFNDNIPNEDYNNKIAEVDGVFYLYNETNNKVPYYGITSSSFSQIYNKIKDNINYFDIDGYSVSVDSVSNGALFSCTSILYFDIRIVDRVQVEPEDVGVIHIDLTKNFVDEPYYILCFPLYNVKITGNGQEYNIDKSSAFNTFNMIISYLSGGDNPYLIDAQIFPYCPVLLDVNSNVNSQPLFEIESTTFYTDIDVNLYPYSDIKKEYISRQYSIISPDQSNKFDFNVYDYIKTIIDNNGINEKQISIKIKTALKPYAIVSSAVIIPESGALIGETYPSDFRGCQPAGNGFECSLSSNAFETYKRQNSNYQQLFNLQKEELQKQHEVERTNEIVSGIVNTVSAATMGAIAGASIGGATADIFGAGSKVGGITGAAVAGGTVGAMMTWQGVENENLRAYERQLQQQTFDLQIGTIKNLPNSISRISSFNEIILQEFYYVIELYECSDFELGIIDNFISEYGYGIGVFDFISNYYKEGWFIRSTLVKSNYPVNLHNIAENEFMGGLYLYEQV